MNIALIKAGGVGSRMNADVPKQFIQVSGKPVVIYTLEVFERHPEIDAIVVVCVEEWIETLRNHVYDFEITKVKSIVAGGKTSLKSIREGLREINHLFAPEDMVLIHDANRPLVSDAIISDVIEKAAIHGSAVAAIPCTDEAMVSNAALDAAETLLDHKRVFRVQTPDAYRVGEIFELIEGTPEEDLEHFGATNVLMLSLKKPVFFAKGSETNIRLTTQDDITMMKSLLTVQAEKGI